MLQKFIFTINIIAIDLFDLISSLQILTFYTANLSKSLSNSARTTADVQDHSVFFQCTYLSNNSVQNLSCCCVYLEEWIWRNSKL